MVDKDAVARTEIAHSAPSFRNYTYRLVAEHEWGLAADVPGHDIAGADATCCNANQQVVRARLGPWAVLKADITKIIKASYLHWHEKTLRP